MTKENRKRLNATAKPVVKKQKRPDGSTAVPDAYLYVANLYC